MKKITLILLGLFLYAGNVSAQGINDRAVIPIAVNLNTILRLNVVSGGNIEFSFNTLSDYTDGINPAGTSPNYQTRFTVASSVNWEVNIYSEDAGLISTDDATGAGTMDLDNIGYHLTNNGTIADADLEGNFAAAAPSGLSSTSEVLVGYDGTTTNAGDVAQNNFTINWRCGTTTGVLMNPQTILEQSIAAGRYATNVFLVLEPITP